MSEYDSDFLDQNKEIQTYKLKFLCKLINQKTTLNTNTIALENIESWSGKLIHTDSEFSGDAVEFQKDDVLFGKLRPYLAKTYLAESNGEAFGDIYVMRPNERITPSFLKYLFLSKELIDLIDSSTYGTKMPRANWDFIGNTFVKVPFKSRQIKITEFLDLKCFEIDQAIAIKEQQISLLNQRKQIVIQKAVIQGLDPNMPMKDSDIDGIGKIPKHWETFFNRRLFRENSRPVKGDELPLSLSQKDGVIPSGEMKEKSLSPAHRNNFKLCFPNDLVVNRFKGHLGVFFQSNYIGIVTFHYGVFEPAKNVYTKYFELLYHTEQYKTLYAGASNGMSIGLQNLSNLNFYRIKSIVPPLEEQKMICDYADKVEKEHSNLIQKLEIQIEKLKEYKTTLINDAVTGKIKVA